MKTKLLSFALLLFGLITLLVSSSVLLDLFGSREREGAYILWIVWLNFICGILYVLSALGIYRHTYWKRYPLYGALGLLTQGCIGLYVHMSSDLPYETKTIGAMAFRLVLTAVFLISTFPLHRSALPHQE